MNTLEKQNERNFGLAMSAIGSIFFIFGFATTFIITLSAKVKSIFDLTEFEAQLLNFAFFISYALVSIPIGIYIKKIGYKWAVIFGLLLMAVGSFLFYPSANVPSFPLFLVSTFILAVGVVFLQTAANPYVSILGPQETASGRLNLTQALNSIATMLAPLVIAVFVFKGAEGVLDAGAAAESVKMPFLIMGAIILLVAFVFMGIKLPEITGSSIKGKSVLSYPHVLLGALAIFAYVGAEVGVGGLIISYLKDTRGLGEADASKFAAIYWGGAMVGRFFGSFMFTNINYSRKLMYGALVLLLALVSGAFVTGWDWNIGLIFMGIALVNFIIMQLGKGKAAGTLAIFAVIAAALALITAFTTGSHTLWTLISIGLFNSIMFPNIFTLAIRDLDSGEVSTAAGIINTLICGGAIVPLFMGSISDATGNTAYSFIIPAICYLYIAFYALKGSAIRR